VRIGQRWRCHDGSEFVIESRNRTHVFYSLADGSHPQYRAWFDWCEVVALSARRIRIDLLVKNYTRVS
jgi:hypothetical protein